MLRKLLNKEKLAVFIAQGFGLGRLPIAPGTWGSLGSLVLWASASLLDWPFWVKFLLVLAIFFVGKWSCHYGILYYKTRDPSEVVIDEIAGQGIPFFLVGPQFIEIIAAFVLFRIFDIFKPWPIKTLEYSFEDKAFGIMFDDILAGIYALITMFLLFRIF